MRKTITESQLRQIVKESVKKVLREARIGNGATILSESFSSKILQRLTSEHNGIEKIEAFGALSYFKYAQNMAPIHMFSDQQIAEGSLGICDPHNEYARRKWYDYDGQDFSIPSKKMRRTGDISNDVTIYFNDGCLLHLFHADMHPTEQQREYYSTNRYRGQKRLAQSNEYNPIGQNRHVGYKNSVLMAQDYKSRHSHEN